MELIVATTESGIIGRNNSLPWYIPGDMKRFKSITEHGIVIMGRKTFESLPNGKLKNRINIVVTRSVVTRSVVTRNEEKVMNDVIFTNMDKIFDILENYDKKVFIIGGSEIYSLFFDYCNVIHITKVYDIEETYDDVRLKFDIFKTCENYDIISSEIINENSVKYQYLTYNK